MNTIPRYMKEYVNAQRKSYINNELMQKKYKDAVIEIIERILKNTEIGRAHV